MTTEQFGRQYELPPLNNPDVPAWDVANQLRGSQYELAEAELARLAAENDRIRESIETTHASIWVSEGNQPPIRCLDTPEGTAFFEVSYEVLEPDQLETARHSLNDLLQDRAEIDGRQRVIAPRLWQEGGTRLFERWQDRAVAPRDALETYYSLWNNYTPDAFYAYCGVTRDEATELFADALIDYAAASQAARDLPDNRVEDSFLSKITMPAQELGINVSEFVL